MACGVAFKCLIGGGQLFNQSHVIHKLFSLIVCIRTNIVRVRTNCKPLDNLWVLLICRFKRHGK